MPEPQDISRKAHKEGSLAAKRFRLPFGSRAWQGVSGSWMGMGTGSSIDFQDHRDYQWGDDPRAIHWAAYARTGQLSMKLFRAELSPLVDIVIDTSSSMSLTEEKALAAEALLFFCLANTDQAGAPVCVHAVNGKSIIPIEIDALRNGAWKKRLPETPSSTLIPSIPTWKPNCLHILISDLLFPGDPAPLLAQMTAGKGLSMILAPSIMEESRIDDTGNFRLVDCETGEAIQKLISPSVVKKYVQAYNTHFALWREACRRRGLLFAQVKGNIPLSSALAEEALHSGIVDAY